MQSNLNIRYAIAWIFVLFAVSFAANCPETITSNLTLTGNLVSNASSTDCVKMNANNIVLDCAGYSIIGTSPDDGRYGVYIPGTNNVTIKNCNIWNFSVGIRTSGGVSNSLIQNNTITRSRSGIDFYVSGVNNNNTITGNTIANTTVSGSPYDEGFGIRIYVSSSSATNNNITYNNISGTTLGIYVPGAINSLIANNNINNTSPIGIALDTNSNSNTVRDNIISSVKYGIQFSVDGGNVVTGGSISNATTAFHLMWATSNTIANVSLANVIGYHIYSNTSSTNNSFINITGLNKGQLGAAADGNCTIGWYVRANVTNGTAPVNAANVTATTGLMAQAWSATTDASGLTPWMVTYDGIYGSTIQVSYNNYTFNASKSTATGNTTYTVASEATVPIVIITASQPAPSITFIGPTPNDTGAVPYGDNVTINVSVTQNVSSCMLGINSGLWDNLKGLGIYNGIFDYNASIGVDNFSSYNMLDLKTFSSGDYHTCYVLSNGNSACYGNDTCYDKTPCLGSKGESTNYTGNNAIAAAAGAYHTCYLLSNGNSSCYGWNDIGQATNYTGGNAVGIAAGYDTTCYLLSNGNSVCYGNDTCNGYMPCLGSKGEATNYTSGNAIALSVGFVTTCYLLSNGNSSCYGLNNYGQANNYTGGDAIAISGGLYHTCYVLGNGSSTCHGNNDDGEAINYTGGDAIAVAAGYFHTCYLLSNGNSACYGQNTSDDIANYAGGDAIALSAGNYYTCYLLSNGSSKCYGYNEHGRANNYTGGDISIPFALTPAKNMTVHNASAATTANYTLYNLSLATYSYSVNCTATTGASNRTADRTFTVLPPPDVKLTNPPPFNYDNISGVIMQFVGGVVDVAGIAYDPNMTSWALSLYSNGIYNTTICSNTTSASNDTDPSLICSWNTALNCAGECENYSLKLNASSPGGYSEDMLPNITVDNIPPSVSQLALNYSLYYHRTWFLRVNITDNYLWSVTPFLLDNSSYVVTGWGQSGSESQGNMWDVPASGAYNTTWSQETYTLNDENVSAYYNFYFPALNDTPTASVPGCLKINDTASWDCNGTFVFPCGDGNCSKPYNWWLIYNTSTSNGQNATLLGIASEQFCDNGGCNFSTSIINANNQTKFIPQRIHLSISTAQKTPVNNSNVINVSPVSSSSNIPLVRADPDGEYWIGFEADDHVNAHAAAWSVLANLSSQLPVSDVHILNPDNFFSPYDAIINLSVNATGEGNITSVVANFSEVNASACGGLLNLTFNPATGLWNGSCSIGQYAQPGPVNQRTVWVSATDEFSQWNVTPVEIILQDIGVPTMNGSNCTRFGNLTTNFTRVFDFSRVNFIIDIQMNESCASGGLSPSTNFSSAALINLTSVNISTWSGADKLSNLSSAITVDIGVPNTFEQSRIFIDTDYFVELNTNATVKLYNLPFVSQPGIYADDSSKQPSVHVASWTTYNSSNLNGGTCSVNATTQKCSTYPITGTCQLHTGYCFVNGSSCSINSSSNGICSLAGYAGCRTLGTNCSLTGATYAVVGNLTFNVSGFSGYNVTENVSPIINITTPSNGYSTNITSFLINLTVNGTGTQPSLILISINTSPVTRYVYNATSGSVTNNTANCSPIAPNGETLRCLHSTTTLVQGDYAFNVTAYDFAYPEPGNNVTSRTTFTIAPLSPDAYEPDNDPSSANWINTTGMPQTHTFNTPTDTDYVKFDATIGYTYFVRTQNLTASSFTDTVMALYNSTDTMLEFSDDTILYNNTNSEIWFTAPATATYYVAVYEYSGATGGSYNLYVQQQGILVASITNVTRDSMKDNATFNISASVSCIGGPCGNVSATLDPELQPGKTKLSLVELAEKEGSIPVIVKLKDINLSSISDGQKGRKSAQTTTQMMVESQNSVLSTLSTAEFQPGYRYTIINGFSGKVTKAGMEKLLANPAVESVAYDGEKHIMLDVSVPLINASSLWNMTINGQSINGTGRTVCILDTGINYTHPDFGSCARTSNINDGSCPKVVGGYDFVNHDNDPMDDQGHGSHVSGIVASMDSVYRGVAPGAKIAMVKVCNATGLCSDSDVIAGIQWCVANASRLNISVISMSLGGYYLDIESLYEDGRSCDNETDTDADYAAAINNAVLHNISVVAASGNGGHGSASDPAGLSSPACVKNAVSVGATDDSDAIASFSNRNNQLDILAPGVDITSTDTDYSSHASCSYSGGHMTCSGTSMATPHVAGSIALISQFYLQSYGRLPTPSEIDIVLKTGGKPIVDTAGRLNYTYPRLNVLGSTLDKGVVPTTAGARPFYTTSSNPSNCGNMTQGSSCNTTWKVNATGESGTYGFFSIYQTSYGRFYSNTYNISIDNDAPAIGFISPTPNSSTYSLGSITVNVSSSENVSSCTLTMDAQRRASTNSPISAGERHTCYLLSNGNSTCYGSNGYGTGQSTNYTGGNAVALAAGQYHTCYVLSNGNSVCYGSDIDTQSTSYTGGDAVSAVASAHHTCYVLSNGNSQCYGDNGDGQSASYTGGDAVSASAGIYHTCYLLSNGSSRCYGDNTYGQATNYTGNDAIAVSAHDLDTCYLLSNGNSVCYGDNSQDQATNYTGGNAVALAVGYGHTCYLLSNGNSTCYGDNTYGQTTSYTRGNAIAVSAGTYHTCYLLSNGSSRCYGYNTYGQSKNYTGVNIRIPASPSSYAMQAHNADTSTTADYTLANLSDGTHIYFAACSDIVGNSNATGVRNVIVDTTNPSISIVSPSQAYYNASAILINISASDANLNTTWFYNGTGTTNTTYTGPVTLGYTDGVYNMTAWANDTVGRMNSTNRTFIVDTINPEIYFTGPTPNSSTYSLNSYIAINVSANDTNFANVTIRLYNATGGLRNSTFSSSPGSLFANYTGLADGNYSFNATVYDMAGRINYTETRAVIINTVYPSLTIASPVAQAYSTSAILVNLSTSGTGIDTRWFYYNSTVNMTYTVPTTVNYSDGVYNLTAWVNDTVGHVTTKNVTFTVDTINPAIGFVTPTPNSSQYVLINSIAINVSANDTNFANVTVRLYNATGGLRNSTFSNVTGSVFVNYTNLSDGLYYFNATVYDMAGRLNYTETRNITVDATAPTVTIVSPTSRMYNNASILVNISVTNSDNSTWFFNGTANETYTTPVTRTFQQGANTLTAWANDMVGHLSTASVNFTVDSVPPNITLNAPAAGSFSPTANVTLSFTPDDNIDTNITCKLYINGTLNATAGVSNASQYNLTRSFTNALRTWYVNCTDDANNSAVSETRNFTVDTVKPTIVFKSPTENSSAYLNRDSALVNVTASDANFRNVTIFFYNSTGLYFNTSGTLTNLFANETPLAEGIYYINATAFDSAGNFNKTETRNFTVDTINPAIAFASPTPNSSAYVLSNSIAVNASATDANFANVTIRLYNATGGLRSSTFSNATGKLFVNYTGLPDGVYYFNATTYDKVGRLNYTETRNVTINTAFPNLTIVSPTARAYNTSDILVNLSTGGVGIDTTWFYNGTANETYTTPVTRTFAEGSNTLIAWVNDSVGHVTTKNVTFTVDTVPPSVTLNAPAPNAFLNTTNVTLSFTPIDNIDTNMTCGVYVGLALLNATVAAQNASAYNLTRSFGEDSHTWYVICSDDANNSAPSTMGGFTVDTVKPAVWFVSPTDNSSSAVNRTFINANVTGNDNWLDSITVSLYNATGGLANSTQIHVALPPSGSLFANFTNLSDGMYYLNATANDSARNLNKTETRGIMVDTVNPAISFAGPTPNTSTYTFVNSIPANVSASDANFANVTIRLYNSTGGLRNSTFSNSTGNVFANYTGLSDGVYYFNATVYDRAGKYNYTETRTVTINTAFPSLTIVSPTAQVYSASTILINLSYSGVGVDTVWFYTNGTDNYTYAAPISIAYDDGIYNMTAWVNDTVGHVTTKNVNFTVDTTNPAISFASPTPNASTSTFVNSIPVNVSSSDANFANVTIRLYLANGTLRNSTTSTSAGSLFVNYTGLADGNYSFNATVYDRAGRTNYTETRTVIINTAFPNLMIVSPTAKVYNTSVILINLSYSGVGVDTVWFYTNGTVNTTYTVPVALTYDDGIYNMTAWVNDTVGHVTTKNVNFTVDTTNPAIRFATPTTNSSSFANSIIVNVSVNDSSLANVTVRLYNATGGLRNQTWSNSSSFLANFSGLAEGTYYFNATAYDMVGRSNSTETRNATVDRTVPQIWFASPTTNSSTGTPISDIEVNLIMNDTNSMNWTLSLFNSAGIYDTYNGTGSIPLAFSHTFNSLSDGVYYLNASVSDLAGNFNKTETRIIVIDTTAPSITLVAPANNSFPASSLVNLSFNMVDALSANATCTVYVNGSAVSAVTAQNNTPVSLPYNASEGNHLWYVNCSDASGNGRVSGTGNFTVDTVSPTITIVSPLLGYYYNVSSVLINISANDTNLDTVKFYTNGTVNLTYTVPVALGFDDGIYNMTAWANDSAGRTVSSGRTFTVDTIAPVVTLDFPTNSTFNTSNLALNYTAVDANLNTCWYVVDAGSPSVIANCANLTAMTGLTNGSHCINVFANDSAGTSANSSDCFTLDLPPETNAPNYSALQPSNANYSEAYRPSLAYLLNATWTDDTGIGTVLIENNFSGALVDALPTSQSGSQFGYYTGYLAAGEYTYRWIANDTLNNINNTMPFRNITILKANPGAALGVSPSWSGTWPYGTTVNCTGAAQVNVTLYRNDTLVGSGFGYAQDVENFSAGAYGYVCNTSGNENYTAGSSSNTLTISKLASALALSASPGWTANWSTTVNVSCSAPSALNISLYRNGTLVGSALGHVEDVSSHAAGAYLYVCNISGNENYTTNSTSNTLTVSKTSANISLLLNGAAGNVQLTSGQTLAMNGSVTTPANGYIELYVDSVRFNNGSGNLYNTTSWSSAGTHTIRLVFNATQNYSAANISRTATIPSSSTSPNAPSTGGTPSAPALPSMTITNYTTCNSNGTANVKAIVSSGSTVLSGVTVYVDPNDKHNAYASGYTFRDLVNGAYVVYADKDGYSSTSLTVTFNCVVPGGQQNQTAGNGTQGGMSRNQTSPIPYVINGSTRYINVTLIDVGADYAVYQVDSLFANTTVYVGQNRTVDVNGDGSLNVSIMLNNVSGNNTFAVIVAIARLAGQQGGNVTPTNATNQTTPGINVTCAADNGTCKIGSDCCSGSCNMSAGICLPKQPPKPFDWLGVLVAVILAIVAMAVVVGAIYFFFIRGGGLGGGSGRYKFNG